MGVYPEFCPNCSERNTFNLDYCAVCGLRFSATRAAPGPTKADGPSKAKRNTDPATIRALRKKRALLTAFREGRISEEKLRKGLRELGGSEEVERALDLKKFLEEQIKTFEKMDLSSRGERYFPDPDASQSDLPRDDNGAVMTDFRASAEDRDYHKKGRPFEVHTRAEGETLFSRVVRSSPVGPKREDRIGPLPRSAADPVPANERRRTVRASGVDWDEDDDDSEQEGESWSLDEEADDEEEFEIEIDEEENSAIKGPERSSVRLSVEWLDEDDDGWGAPSRRGKKGLK